MGQNVTGSPTTSDPWRVDVNPLPITRTSSTPNTGPVTSADPTTNPATPSEPETPLCELFPDILACAKLGDMPSVVNVTNVDKNTPLTKDSGWGPENGSCPSPRSISLTFGTVYMPWDTYCSFAQGIKPLVVGLAYLTAALTFMGLGRKE